MGIGEILVAWGTVNGKPCIVLQPSPRKGVVGVDAPEYWPLVEAKGTIIAFEPPESIEALKHWLDEIALTFKQEDK